MSSLTVRPLPRRARYALAAAITATVLSLIGQGHAFRVTGASAENHAAVPVGGR